MNAVKVVAGAAVLVFLIFVGYFVYTSSAASTDVPPHVTGEMRGIYLWAKTPEGSALLEQVPCYCGCAYEGHLHARHCFWKDDGTFDKHGLTCSVCFDIARKAKQRFEQGKDACTIVKEVDAFYAPNKHLRTKTPLPTGCTQ